uniref:Uncharacterized protein n=1 Tax=Rhizophora mucronata TaxID=61149 RepID=A0A2P2ITV6_RHIMU
MAIDKYTEKFNNLRVCCQIEVDDCQRKSDCRTSIFLLIVGTWLIDNCFN